MYSILRGRCIENIEQSNNFNRDIDQIKLYEDVVYTFVMIFENLYIKDLVMEHISDLISNSNEESINEP